MSVFVKQATAAKYNERARPQSFQHVDLVLRPLTIEGKNAGDDKPVVNWKGPYKIKIIMRTLSGEPIPII